MPERSEKLLKLACAVLAVVLLFQFGKMLFGRDALSRLTIPPLPTLTVETNAPATNAPAMANAGKGGTNAVRGGTNMIAGGKGGTNASQSLVTSTPTNVVVASGDKGATNLVRGGTNMVVGAKGTNAISGTNALGGTNLVSGGSGKTNSVAKTDGKRGGPANMPPGMPPNMAMMMAMGGLGGSAKPAELPLPIQARIFKITDSEILGPVMRPLPTALLGIVGESAFIRAASGQSGVIKEGENVGALKLIKIGINRVLVEEDGQKKELMIFSGYGGETLMPKQKDNSK